MKTLYNVLNNLILEGGASGHMAHPIDYTEFTRDDLIGLVKDLFSGKITDITEKVDGTNIQATMNQDGEVVFIRNKSNLNSEQGGMSISDMAAKWADKPSVAETFLSAGETIKKVFSYMDKKWFNPDDNTRRVVNCECVIAGVTNIMPYATAQVDFHNIWVYKKYNGEWIQENVTKDGLDIINKACEKVDGAQITPKVIIEITNKSNELAERYSKEINNLFNGLNYTIDEWKFNKFHNFIVSSKYKWVLQNPEGERILFNRWFNMVKSPNIREIKKMYPGHDGELLIIDKKEYKDIVGDIMEPLDNLFLNLGNDIIDLCKGIINDGQRDEVVTRLKKDMDDVVRDVKKDGSVETQAKLTKQLNRLSNLGNKINPVEGIVFSYKGRLMKLTGSFAPLNQILGSIKFSR